jgi:hypothetical protein
VPVQRPTVFIGSSTEGSLVAQEVQNKLEKYAESTIWEDGVFRAGDNTLERLIRKLDEFDFAVFVLSPDDTIEVRGQNYASPRDNVLFELGLFMGSLGRNRTFIVHAAGANLKLPSDLDGITMSPYRPREDKNLAAAVSSSCTNIIRAIVELKIRESRKIVDLWSPERLHSYKCPESERSAKDLGTFLGWASKSTYAKYLVLRGLDILSKDGEIARVCGNAGPLLEIKLLMVDFDTMSSHKFQEIRETMDLNWDKDANLETERRLARERLVFARELSEQRSGFQYRVLPSDVIPEIKLRLYNHIGFFTFYRKKVGFSSVVQNRPIFCVEDPERSDFSPLRTTLERWFEELWNQSRPPA